MLLDGALTAQNGSLRPQRTTPGFGLRFKSQDAEKFLAFQGEVNA
jgi:hypothetical protein